MRKIDKWIISFCLLLTFLVAALNSCHVTVNNKTEVATADTVYVEKIVPDKKLETKVKKLKKTLRFRTYQRDSLQCKLDSFIYSIIKNQ